MVIADVAAQPEPRTDPPAAARSRPGPALACVIAILVAATFIPLGYVAWSVASIGPRQVYELVARPRVGELLVNTVGLVVVTVPICIVLGVGAAWLVERTDVPGRNVWRPLFVAPLAVPAFINSYAWVSVVPSLHGFGAGVLVADAVVLPVRLRSCGRHPAPAGPRDRGIRPRTRLQFDRPSSSAWCSPSSGWRILGGGLLIGVHLLAEYGAFAMLRFSTFTTAIFEQFQATFNGAAGSTLAGGLVLLCLVLLVGRSCRAGQRPLRRASGRAHHGCRRHIGCAPARFRPPPALAALVVLALGVPVWTIGALAVDRRHHRCGHRRHRALPRPDHRAGRAWPHWSRRCWRFRSRGWRCGYSGFLARFVEGANFVTQLDARHRDRARVGHRRHSLRPAGVPDGDARC